MTLIVNPGAEWHPEQSSPEAAARNVEAFAAELTALGHTVTSEPIIEPADDEAPLLMGGIRYQPDHDGRYPFRLVLDGHRHVLEMPGLPLDEVRYLGRPANPWDFPRLFIDGSSWLWKYAIGVLTDENCACDFGRPTKENT